MSFGSQIVYHSMEKYMIESADWVHATSVSANSSTQILSQPEARILIGNESQF